MLVALWKLVPAALWDCARAAHLAPLALLHLSAGTRETRKPRPWRRSPGSMPSRYADRQSSPGRSSHRRESRGTSPLQAPSDRPPATSRNTRPHTNPDTTPIRSRACHTAPRRSASSRPPGASCCPSSRHTTHIRPAPTHRPRSNTASCSPPGRHIPTGPRWATGTCLPQRPTSH